MDELAGQSAIFLDLEGVMHGKDAVSGEYFVRDCVRNLNYIINETGANVVLSSSWRNTIIGGSMNLAGFWLMLQTHGIHCELVGHTASDEETPNRYDQIWDWVSARPEYKKFVVLDDMDMRKHFQGRQVLVDGRVGLTKENADEAIRILNGK